MRPLLLDLFCKEGGAGMGYYQAGFDVVGVDIEPQPRYPFAFEQDDAIQFLRRMIEPLARGCVVAIHASPPCRRYSDTQRIRGNEHPDLIGPTRVLLRAAGVPYVIENVEGARGELHDPVMLCGAMFGLRTYRHRLFETSWPLRVPAHPRHVARQAKMGRPPQPGEFIQCVGNFSNVALGREVMGMPWASRDGLREAIPAAYTRHIGAQLLRVLRERRAA